MNAVKKYWPILLALALLAVWVCESTSDTANKIRQWIQNTLGSAFTGFVELAAVVVIAIVLVVVVFALPEEIALVAIVAVSALLAYAGWKLWGWFSGVFGGGSSTTPVTQPGGSTTTPPGPTIPGGSGWSLQDSGQLPGATYNIADGSITLPNGATWNPDNSVTINGLTYNPASNNAG